MTIRLIRKSSSFLTGEVNNLGNRCSWNKCHFDVVITFVNQNVMKSRSGAVSGYRSVAPVGPVQTRTTFVYAPMKS